MMLWLFSYGSLHDESVQRATFGRLLSGERDRLAGFHVGLVPIVDPMVVEASGSAHHANAVYDGRHDSFVDGMAYKVTDAELAVADRYERADDYDRVRVSLASGREAWVYVHRPARSAND